MTDSRDLPISQPINNHSDVLLLAKILGYNNVDKQSAYVGLANKAMEAVLSKNITMYEHKLNFISKLIETVIQSYAEKLKYTDSASCLELFLSLPRESKAKLRGLLENELDKLLNKEQSEELHFFLDSILFQDPAYYEYLLSDKTWVQVFPPICFSFNSKELTLFLDKLKNSIFLKTRGSKVLIINANTANGSEHMITLGYDPPANEWCLLDPNQIIMYTNEASLIAKTMMGLFQYAGYVNLAMDIYGLKTEKNNLSSLFMGLQQELEEQLQEGSEKLTRVDHAKETLLILAVRNEYDEWIDVFLKASVDPNYAYDKEEAKLLRYTLCFNVKENNLEVMRKLLEQDIDPNKVIDMSGMTLLHLAALLQNMDMMDLLIQYGADIEIKNNMQKTPLDYFKGDKEVVFVLMERHARNMLVGIKNYIEVYPWQVNSSHEKIISDKRKVIKMPMHVKMQWDQIQKAENAEMLWRSALKKVIQIAQMAFRYDNEAKKTQEYYGFFAANNYQTIRRNFFLEVAK